MPKLPRLEQDQIYLLSSKAANALFHQDIPNIVAKYSPIIPQQFTHSKNQQTGILKPELNLSYAVLAKEYLQKETINFYLKYEYNTKKDHNVYMLNQTMMSYICRLKENNTFKPSELIDNTTVLIHKFNFLELNNRTALQTTAKFLPEVEKYWSEIDDQLKKMSREIMISLESRSAIAKQTWFFNNFSL